MNAPPEETHVPDCLKGADIVALPKGARVFQAGERCDQFFYLVSGAIRVDLLGKSGRTIMLYRFGAKETCVLTTSCLLSGDAYCAEAHVEEDATACVVPYTAFETRLNDSSAFRRLVFSSFSERLAAMMAKIEEIAFVPIETRLADRVLQLRAKTPVIHATHGQLAADLGTSREVVSRKLAQWEKLGLIERGRGSFRLLNVQELRRMATLGD